MLERHRFVLQFASFETDQSVGQSVLLLGGNVLPDDLDQIRQGHYGTAHDEVEQLFFLFGTGMTEGDVFQSDGIGHFCRHTYFLADAVYQMKLGFGEQDGERNAGKSSSCTQIHDLGSGTELNHFGDA